MNAVDIVTYGQGTALQAVEGLPASAWDLPGACGVWSIKDIIAHLASYELVLVDVLTSFTGSDPTPYLDKFTGEGHQFNDAEVGLRKGRTVEEVLAEFNDAHARVMSLLANIPAEMLRKPGTLPWYGMNYALDDHRHNHAGFR